MLVLTRKVDQQIQIGDGVVITVLQVNGNKVRIGIEAPKEVRIARGELDLKEGSRPADRPNHTSQPVSRGADERMLTFSLPTAPVQRNAAPLVRSASRLAAGALRPFMLPRR